LVVADDLDFGAQFSQVLNKVIGERIVVIDDQNHTEPFRRKPKEDYRGKMRHP
jgi:hypothetical protein